METFDEVLVDASNGFMDKAKHDGKPFFIWHNTTRMHVFTYIAPKYQAMMNYQTNYGLEEAGMAQMDDSIGALLKHLDDIGEADNTIVIFTTDNGAEVFTWPDGGMTPFKATKGTVFEGGFRVPAIIRWPGKIKPGSVENGIFSGLDWLPTLTDAAGNPNITQQLLQGVQLGDRTYKNHLDGYDQIDLLLAKARRSAMRSSTSAGPSRRPSIRRLQIPVLPATLRLARGEGHDRHAGHCQPPPGSVRAYAVYPRRNLNQMGGGYMNDFYAREFWRFVAGAAGGRQTGGDGDRFSAHAGSGVIQPRCGQTPGR